MLHEIIGDPATLEQLSEECTELAQASLKYARYLRGENKVHGKTEEEMVKNILEEIADVTISSNEAIDMLEKKHERVRDIYYNFYYSKKDRMIDRLCQEGYEIKGE